MSYKQKLSKLFEHEEWNPEKSLGSKSEFGEATPICSVCDIIGQYAPGDNGVPLNWCESCEDHLCDDCWTKQSEEWGHTGRLEICHACWARHYE
jgi:hypothetical protein